MDFNKGAIWEKVIIHDEMIRKRRRAKRKKRRTKSLPNLEKRS
jgi:hypothetical protein